MAHSVDSCPARLSRCALACLALATTAAAGVATAQVSVVTITGQPLPAIGGFGDLPESKSPLATTTIGVERLAEIGARSLGDLTRLDASVADAYNSEGYWTALTVRGFVLDPRSNYRRDGLPISAETWLPLANKERLEVLKGTSGMQAGTSAPGGLANLVVKRPMRERRDASLEWREEGSVAAAADLAQRFGGQGEIGVRVNLGAERLRPATRNTDGRSHVLAIAGDLRATPDTLIEAEFERSHRSQPSVPGFSLLGGRIPGAQEIDPRINLNNQPWSLPVVFDGSTGSLRLTQRLPASLGEGDWLFVAHGALQRLRTDDRVAFPFGCFDAGSGTYYPDRYCPDGSFDLYDYRSEGERRTVAAFEARAQGSATLAGRKHHLVLGALASRSRDRFNRQAFNFAGTGSIRGDLVTPAAPDLTGESTQRDEESFEAFLRDRIELAPQWQLWAGLRATRLQRESVRTDGSEPTAYTQSFVTPWLALSHALTASTTLYASAGQGVESAVVPNRARYSNAGQPLPALKSRQLEAGVKHDTTAFDWRLTAFDIARPLPVDRCDAAGTLCASEVGPRQRHRGAEAAAGWTTPGWSLQASAIWLRARIDGGGEPTNVPERSARLQGRVDVGPVALLAFGSYEGPRHITPAEDLELPGWTRWDLAARWRATVAEVPLSVRVGVDNVGDKRAWRESPYQFGHSYLFPLAPRTWRASVAGSF
ncbi:MAG: TonB-dependent receptor [Burkholderiales bacterium]|nr:TonB-dependent receptor [Burkholderiales bacterium]